MANEAVCIETPTIFARRTIATGTLIPFGSLMELTGPNTVAISNGDDVFGGIAWQTILAADSFVEIVVALNGVWDIKDSSAGMAVGNLCSVNGINLVKTLIEADVVLGKFVGKVMETAGASDVVRVNVGSMV